MAEKEINALTRQIIGCAITVHRELGPGLLESIYEEALCVELELAGLRVTRQKRVPIIYREKPLATPLKLDLLVEEMVIVEVKAVETVIPVHEAQLLSYLRLTTKDVGLLLNFNVATLRDGIRRKTRVFPMRKLRASKISVPSVPSVASAPLC